MKTATLALMFDGDHLLFAEKKEGEIGTGVLSGPGGKREPGESLMECLIREAREEWEIELDPLHIEKVAYIIFYAAGAPDFGVHVYRVRRFTGVLKETKDAKLPERFPLDALPYDRMFEGDRHWFSRAVSGEPFSAHVYYKERAKEFDRIEFLPLDDLFEEK
jgi:8-oxo-dGTP diphosphatase